MARREGWYIRRIREPGVDTLKEAVALAWAVMRDYRRGYTYDNDNGCRKIKMDWSLAEKRLNYIPVLAKKHGAGPRTLARIKKLIEFVKSHRRLPKRVYGKETKTIIKEMRAKTK